MAESKTKNPGADETGAKTETPKALARYRLKEGAKLATRERDDDGNVVRKLAGDIVLLTPAQAKAWADRIEPV